MTPLLLIWSRTEMSLRTDRRWISWFTGFFHNLLELNPHKIVEKAVEFKRRTPSLPSLTILNNTVSTVDDFWFLGGLLSLDLRWCSHTDSVQKKAQQRLFFLLKLKMYNLPQVIFYIDIVWSVLCVSITEWFGSSTNQTRFKLEQTIRSSERIIRGDLSFIQDLYRSRVREKAVNISTHRGHKLVRVLP